MPNANSHGTDNSRAKATESAAGRIVDWINEPSNDRARNRIRRLLVDMRFYADAYETVADEDGDEALSLKPATAKAAIAATRRILRVFRSYKFYPQLLPFGGIFPFQWAPISGPDGKFKKRWPPVGGEYSDCQAIFELTWLFPHDFTRIRECSCGKWMYAKFSHQRFCSIKCREKEFRSSPEWKAYRRDKAREYYWLHKSGKVK